MKLTFSKMVFQEPAKFTPAAQLMQLDVLVEQIPWSCADRHVDTIELQNDWMHTSCCYQRAANTGMIFWNAIEESNQEARVQSVRHLVPPQ